MEKMRALVLYGPGDIRLEERPVPIPGADEVLIKVEGCGICGTDMHVYRGMANSWSLPGIIGHEFSGVVCETGRDVTDFKCGDMVTAEPLLHCGKCVHCLAGRTNLCSEIKLIGGELPGGMAEYVSVPVRSIARLPRGLSPKTAALTEPVATVLHALGRLRHKSFKTAVILGTGSLGLIALQMLLPICDRVLVSDVSGVRLEKAKRLGAHFASNALSPGSAGELKDKIGNPGAELVIELAGQSSTRELALSLVRPGGEVLCIALGQAESPVDFQRLVTQEISIYGTQCHTLSDIERAVSILDTGLVTPDELVSWIAMEDGSKAFSALEADPSSHVKAVLIP